MTTHRRNVKRDAPAQELAADLTKFATTDLWDMLETNLRRLTAAWEGSMSQRDQDQRVRLCVAITKEVRSRGLQLRLQF